MDWKLNILDIVMTFLTIAIFVVTILITKFVRSWDRRNLRDSLLWETCKGHWRAAIALEENSQKSADQFSDDEVKERRLMLGRTSHQIRILDGDNSSLADAFKEVSSYQDWSTPSASQTNAVKKLTAEMTRKFG